MSIAEFIKLGLGCVGVGAFIMFVKLIFGGLHNIDHPSYVEYSDENDQQAAVYIYWINRSRGGSYHRYDFIRKNGKWKTDGEFKVLLNILIAAVVAFIMEIIHLVIADAGIDAILPAFLLVFFWASIISAIPLADIILACNALDDDLREKRNKNI